MANILPEAAPTTFRTWKTCTERRVNYMFVKWRVGRNMILMAHAASWAPTLPFHNHLSLKLATAQSTRVWCSLSPDWHCPLISQSSHSRPCCCKHTLDTCSHLINHKKKKSYMKQTSTDGHIQYLQLKSTALVHDVIDLHLWRKQQEHMSVSVQFYFLHSVTLNKFFIIL